MEKILSIVEADFKDDSCSWGGFEGFIVTTDKQVIKMGISNSQSCCENWGSFMTEDDTSEFIGANLISISSTDDALNGKTLDTLENDHIDIDACMFINLATTNGVLQFVMYNEHNGYYSHDVVVKSEQLSINTSI